MSFLKLKFLSLACLSLGFLTNVMANCVDLTGTYHCPNGLTTISYSVSTRGVPTYFYKDDEGLQTLIANGKPNFLTLVTCDKNNVTIVSLISIVQELSLSDNEEELIVTLYGLKSDDTLEYMTDYSCERIQSSQL